MKVNGRWVARDFKYRMLAETKLSDAKKWVQPGCTIHSQIRRSQGILIIPFLIFEYYPWVAYWKLRSHFWVLRSLSQSPGLSTLRPDFQPCLQSHCKGRVLGNGDNTFELNALSGSPSKHRNRRVVMFLHQRAEQGTCWPAVPVGYWSQSQRSLRE